MIVPLKLREEPDMNIVKILRTEPDIPTGVTCARCGREIKARNEKAREAIQKYQGDAPLECADCFEGRRHG